MRSTPLQPAEVSSAKWTRSKFLAGGLRSLLRRDPFDEAKAGEETSEKTSCSSQPPTPLTTTPEAAAASAQQPQLPLVAPQSADNHQVAVTAEEKKDKTNGGAVIACLADGVLVDPR